MYLCTVLVPIIGPACQKPEAVYRHGKATDGTQRYRCPAYWRTFQLQYRQKVHEPGVRAKITDRALNGSGVRDTARVLGSGPHTVLGELKKN